ncbi:MAG: flagellar basal body rod protein FlgC [Deltaproteobacteria bacterium]|nr:MAG: flagellar basal body rod protein FlgC [Deltaproteobacteria bacterium]
MDFFTVLKIGGSALSAQRIRLNVIATNLANIHTTRTPEGGPYRRRDVVFRSQPMGFEGVLRSLQGVRVVGVIKDSRPFPVVYNPSHPDADEEGYVRMPNVNLMEEMTNLILAARSYEAAAAVIATARDMALRILEIGR